DFDAEPLQGEDSGGIADMPIGDMRLDREDVHVCTTFCSGDPVRRGQRCDAGVRTCQEWTLIRRHLAGRPPHRTASPMLPNLESRPKRILTDCDLTVVRDGPTGCKLGELYLQHTYAVAIQRLRGSI